MAQDLKLGYDSDLTIRHAAAARAAIADVLSAEGATRIAINPDAAVDLSFVQLLSAARLHARNSGGSLSLTQPAGPGLRELLLRAGFLEAATPEDLNFWFHSENAQ